METMHQPGEVIAERYRIIDTLGRGGVGITYAAEDLQGDKRVALKALSLRRMTDWKKMELFEREAKVLSQLSHAAIPRYLDYFQADFASDRCFYIAQELAPGQSLAALVENGWQPEETEVRRLAAKVLEILIYLQSLTPPVIHRDIKPPNIIRSEDGQIFLVDFGAVVDSYRHTIAGGSTVVGTYGYMAPEQFRGQAALETDLHGLGATLLFLLTGKSPADLPRRQLRIDFRSSLHVSGQFADWLEKMLEPAREDRFQSAEEALAVLQGEREIAPSLTPKRRKPKGSPIRLNQAEELLAVEIPPVWLRSNYHAVLALLPPLLSGFFFAIIIDIYDLFNINIFLALLVMFVALIYYLFNNHFSVSLLENTLGGLSHTRLDIDRDYLRFEQHLLGWCHQKFCVSTKYIERVTRSRIGLPLRKKPLTFLTMQFQSGQKHSFGLFLDRGEHEWLVEEIAAFLEKTQLLPEKGQTLEHRNFLPEKVAYGSSLTTHQVIPKAFWLIVIGLLLQQSPFIILGSIAFLNSVLLLVLKKESTYCKQGLFQYNQGDYRGAIQYYDRAINLKPKFVDAYLYRGLARSALGDKQTAIQDYDIAINLNDKCVDAYLYRGLARSALGDNQTAIKDYDMAISLKAGLAEAYLYRGLALYCLHDKQGAIREYNRAIGMKPKFSEAYYHRGKARAALGEKQKAIEDYDRAISLNQRFVEAYFYRGVALSYLGYNRKAIKDYSHAISLKPQVAQSYLYRGVAYLAIGNHQTAIKDYDRAISFNSDLTEAYLYRGWAYSKLGDNQTAIENYDTAINLNPKAEAYCDRGTARSLLGDNQTAIEDFNTAINLNPDLAEAYLGRGWARSALGDNQAAIEDFNRAISLNPDLAEAYLGRGWARSALGDDRGSIEDYDRAISLDTKLAAAYFLRGAARSNLGDYRGAIEDFTELVRLQPTDNNYYNRGVIYYLVGNYSEAIRDLKRALIINPKFVAAYYNRGNARYELGDEPGATEDYNLALQLEPADMDASDEHGFYGRGLAMSRMGRVEEARADLQKAAQICSDRHNTTLHKKIMAAIEQL